MSALYSYTVVVATVTTDETEVLLHYERVMAPINRPDLAITEAYKKLGWRDEDGTDKVLVFHGEPGIVEPIPPVSNRTYWFHDTQGGQYIGPHGSVTKRAPRWYSHNEIHTVREFKETLRAGDAAWPGGYPLFFVHNQGGDICFKCARENFRSIVEAINTPNDHSGWCIIGCQINDEDNELRCDSCSELIPSSIGNDDNNDS